MTNTGAPSQPAAAAAPAFRTYRGLGEPGESVWSPSPHSEPRVALLRRLHLDGAQVTFRADCHVDDRRISLIADVQGRLTPAVAAAAARVRDSLVASLRDRGHDVSDVTGMTQATTDTLIVDTESNDLSSPPRPRSSHVQTRKN